MSNFRQFTIRCACGALTSKSFARANGGKCKACATGIPRENTHKQRTGRCEDAPCCGCCGPQGDGDYYGYSAMEAAMDGGY